VRTGIHPPRSAECSCLRAEGPRLRPGRELLLKARGWPAREAHVRIRACPHGEHGQHRQRRRKTPSTDRAGSSPVPYANYLIAPRKALRRLGWIADGLQRDTQRTATTTSGPDTAFQQ